ncbi:acetolactate synthase [Pelagicoccus sp. SDUM812005]|uniref:acetolactate synthase n=1 Tax=Pelagicoccus sp. SDUM812005 TaxID=3041257 RepID=UPI00280E83C1|nr:acetolactate synthase [Pelagicoccus sp. SDUM812005]MDQ8179862.1 acetolactate synthase [Pelagicoccus sp. SDUM812005]
MDNPSIETETAVPDPVKQLSIFMENKVGRLSDIFRLFEDSGIHVMALTTLDTTDCAITRVVVDDPQKAKELLWEHDVTFSESEVLAVEIAGEHDMNRVLASLLQTEINIHYIYAFVSRPHGRSALVISIEDTDLAVHILNTHNIRVLSQRDISR